MRKLFWLAASLAALPVLAQAYPSELAFESAPRGPRAEQAVWTPAQFAAVAVDDHIESVITEPLSASQGAATTTENKPVEVRRFLAAALSRRGAEDTFLPNAGFEDDRSAIAELETRLGRLFDGGVSRAEVKSGQRSAVWQRGDNDQFAMLTVSEPGRRMRFNVAGPGNEDPRLSEFSVSVEGQDAQFGLKSSVVLSQDAHGKEPASLVAIIETRAGESLAKLQARLRHDTRLMRNQALRAAKLALELLSKAG